MPMGGTLIQARPGPIPWRAMQEWCDRTGHHGVDREFIVQMVKAMDGEFLADWARKQAEGPRQAPDDKLARWEAAD